MTAERHEPSELDQQIEAYAEKNGVSLYMARAAINGYWDPVEPIVDEEAPLPDPHQRVSPHHVKPGHVRDFADGGRADEYRGGDFKPPLTPAAEAAWEASKQEVTEAHDDLVQARLMDRIATGELTHGQAQAIWQRRVEELGRQQK